MNLSYKDGNSLFHKLDPITKLTWTILISIWLFSLTTPLDVLIVSASAGFLALLGAKLRVKHYLKMVFMVIAGGAFIILYQGIFREGPGIDVLGITLSYKGLSIGIAILLRTIGIVGSALAFSSTTSPQDLELGLEKLGIPYKYAHLFYLALRFIPMFNRDLQHVQDAQKIRGVKKGLSAFKTAVISLVATELRHTDDTALSLETKGFGLYNNRTRLKEIHISRGGALLNFVTTLLMVIHLLG